MKPSNIPKAASQKFETIDLGSNYQTDEGIILVMIVICSQILIIVISSQIFPLLYDSINPSSHEASFYCWFLDMDDTTVAYRSFSRPFRTSNCVFSTLPIIQNKTVWMPRKQCSATYSFYFFVVQSYLGVAQHRSREKSMLAPC